MTFFAQSLSINNVPAFYRDDFVFRDLSSRKQTTFMNLTLAHFGFARTVRKLRHNLATLIVICFGG
ncbi:MAG: hypothetical protein DME99_12860 [Verrucomicrobia bacterium]|nr:MAG: hypothetical protein DME99_12860 [Verrucomicrobiota bacterium]